MAIGDKNIAGQDFWLNFAAESIYKTFEKKSKAIDRLQALIKWGIGLFSASGIIFFFFPKGGTFNPQSMIALGIAVAFLILGYFFAERSGIPRVTNYNPNDTTEIADKFSEAVKSGSWFFGLAIVFTFIGFAGISLGIVSQSFGSNLEPNTESNLPSIKTKIVSRSDTTYVPVTVEYEANKEFYLAIHGFKNKPDKKDEKPISLKKGVFLTNDEGQAFISSFTVVDSLTSFKVNLMTKKELEDGSQADISVIRELSKN